MSEVLTLMLKTENLEIELKLLRSPIIKAEKTKNQKLNRQVENLSFENVSLATKIFDLENAIKDMKPSESLESRKSSIIELSPKEIKRQSIHDQRRGIDSQESGDAMLKEANEIEKELTDLIAKVAAQIEALISLEFKVQEFIRELDGSKRYGDEKDTENEALKKQIAEGKVELQKKTNDCSKCKLLKKHIKQLEDLHKTNMFKFVGLQTRIYDLQNTAKVVKTNQEETRRLLTYRITKLEEKLLEKTSATETTHAETQAV